MTKKGDEETIYQHDVIEATFQPRRTDDLKPPAVEMIGQRREWYVSWQIEPDDDGPYVGEFACSFHSDPPDPHPDFVWVPSGDLTDITLISGGFVRVEADERY
jgi:hypothetical protein